MQFYALLLEPLDITVCGPNSELAWVAENGAGGADAS